MTRDIHRQEIIRKTGIKVVSPPAAKSVNKLTGERVEKERYIRTECFEYEDGSIEEVEIWARGGRLCRVRYDESGDRQLDPLRRTGNRTTRNNDGTWNDYVEYALPDPRTGDLRTIRERTITSLEDEAAGFKRGEYIHQIPPGDPDYDWMRGRRQDSESVNRGIDDFGAPYSKARSYGAKSVLFDLIGHQMHVGALALHLDERRRLDEAA